MAVELHEGKAVKSLWVQEGQLVRGALAGYERIHARKEIGRIIIWHDNYFVG